MLERTETADGLTEIAGARIELIKRGSGRPLLLLHPAIGIKATDAVIDRLARSFTVLAPSHPGFGRSELPPAMTTVDDLAYFYLDVMQELDLREAVLAGISFGGWIAAEIAIKSTERISHLVLADAVGIKLGNREHRDIADMFTIKQSEIDRLAYHDPTLAAVDHPTLVLWGASDRIVSPDYGRAYAKLIAGAQFELIEQAGHYPHLERPDLFAERIVDFAA
jgi:pimeloyl-ACP methyl ester carboxylesterase